MVIAEQPTETLAAYDLTVSRHVLRGDDFAVQALVRTLSMVMCEVLGQNAAQLSFAGQDEVVEHLGFQRENPAFRVGIAAPPRP